MTDWPPRVLCTLYRNGLRTFYELLVDLVTNSLPFTEESSGGGGDHQFRDAELRQEADKRLIGDKDPPEYLTLLKKSYAVMSETAPKLGQVSFEQRWTQEQIVERVVVLQFQQVDKPSHVLCSGYRKLRPSLGKSKQRRSPHGLECACENSSVDTVNSTSWKTLLSRVGDLIMLHVLTHASVFFPLPNNCFLQVSGGPTSFAVSMPGKSFSLHPGEKMIGAASRKKWMSKSCTIQHKQMVKNFYFPGVRDEGKQPASSAGENEREFNTLSQDFGNTALVKQFYIPFAEPPAVDTTSIADEFKQADAGDVEFSGEKVTGIVRNQTSNLTVSFSLKRHRTESIESTETGLRMDVLERNIKFYDLSKGTPDSERQRRGFRHEACHESELLKPLLVDISKDTVFKSVRNSLHDTPAKCSEASIQTESATRGISIQYSVDNEELLSDGGNPLFNNLGKRRKRIEMTEKDKYSQQGNKRYRALDRAPAEFNAKEPQHLNRDEISRKNFERCTELEEGPFKDETVPRHFSNPELRENAVIQEASAPPSQAASACSSGKRVRLPSWKRRKLRQAQESCQKPVCTDVLLETCGEGQLGISEQVNISQNPVAKAEEIIRKEDPHSSASGFHKFQASDRTGFDCNFLSWESIVGKGFGSMAPKNRMTKKKIRSDVGTAGGIPERLIDRAPIFYNSNFACHPGLPAKHILNTAEPNEAGVTHLFSAIFGGHCNILICSCSVGNTNADYSRSKLKPGLFKSIHKLLQELLSNARRCKFGRLLGRHCPLPEGFQKDSPSRSALVPESKTRRGDQKDNGLDKDMAEDEEQVFLSPDHTPEVQDIMSLWLGPNYQPTKIPTARHLEANSGSPSNPASIMREFSSIAQQAASSSFAVTKEVKQSNTIETSEDANLTIEKTKQSELISCHTTHSKVVGFLWAVCRSIIPQDMLGCLRSWRALRSSIAHFVGLRRHEKFNVKHVLFRLPLSSFSWLAFKCCQNSTTPQPSSRRVTDEEGALQQRRLELWLHWLFASLVVPLIRAHFYVTEHENHRQTVFYYRKPVWARIRSNGVRELTSKSYKKLSRKAVAEVLNSRVLGFSQIRLLPKTTGLRPIANLAASSQGTLKFSIRTKRKATLRQMLGKVLREGSSGDCYGSDDQGLPNQIAPPIMKDKAFCIVVEPCEASPSTDAEKDAVVAVSSSVGWCSDGTTIATRGSSSADKPKKFKKSVPFSFRSINSVLKDVHCCLKLEKDAHPEDLGSSVFGYCDIHRMVLPFIIQLKESLNGMPRLFMAVCDVTKAYDTIPQENLQRIVGNFVQSPNYKVARYTCITPTLASVRVSHGRVCTPADQFKKFVDSVLDLATKRSHCIFVDQAFSINVRRDQVLAMLREHVTENIVQIGSHFYQQKVGIPQGSILSSLLCSLFYGQFDVHSLLPSLQSHETETFDRVLNLNPSPCDSNVESADNGPCLTSSISKVARSHEFDIEQMLELSLETSDLGQDHFWGSALHVEKELNSKGGPSNIQDDYMPSICMHNCEETGTFAKDSVLLRLIDDSLFISTSEEKAKIFVESMHKGSKEYGCQANERKTATSFCLQLGNEALPRKVYKTEDGACFMRWSGLLVNCFTLEFQADYTRYCGEHIRSALTVRREQNQGWQLVLKMCQYMRPKCHALFFDPRINSPATIRLNAFQAFLLCAMKFHAYVCCLPRVTGSNEPFLYKAIDCAIRYMYGLLRHKMDSVGANAVAYFPYKELEWLALVAFYRVLKRKQARYRILLHMLLTQLQMAKYNKLTACPHLSSATDERRSSMFKFIKY